MKRKTLCAGVLLLAAAIGVWFFLYDRDERQIRLLMEKTADTVTKSSGETAAVGAMKSSRCRKLLTGSFSFVSDHPAWEGNNISASDAAALLFQMRRNCDPLVAEIEVKNIQIDGSRATVEARCRLRGNSTVYRGDFDEVRRAIFSLVKTEGVWQIASAEFSCLLQK